MGVAYPDTRGYRGAVPSSMSRREFLRRSAAIAAAIPAAEVLLTACSGTEGSSDASTTARKLARPDDPVEWPILGEPIPSDLPIEKGGVLRLYTWEMYVKPSLLRRFEDETGVRVEVTEFADQFDAVAHLRTGGAGFDVVIGITVDVLGSLVGAGLAQPLNHDYLSGLSGLWGEFQNPYYDLGSRYTVPYFVWTSGLAWRNDVIPDAAVRYSYNPYGIFWQERFDGRSHLLNGSRESTAMALLKNGIFDVNTEDPEKLDIALQDLLDLAELTHPRFDHRDYRDLFGRVVLHQSWSGNIGFMRFYAPEPSDMRNISFWWPPQGGTGFPGVVGSDTMLILSGTEVPVAAHALIDFLLDPSIAVENATYEGYQPPLRAIEPGVLIERGTLPPHLKNVLVSEEDFAEGHPLLELSPAGAQAWDQIYAQVLFASRTP